MHYIVSLNSLPNDIIADWSKINVVKQFKCGFGRIENMVGKGENAGYQHFLLFSTMFLKALFLRVINSRDCVVKS